MVVSAVFVVALIVLGLAMLLWLGHTHMSNYSHDGIVPTPSIPWVCHVTHCHPFGGGALLVLGSAMPTHPTRIVIGPLTWTVDYSHKAILAANKEDGVDRIGMTEHGALHINVDGHMPESLVRETLHHELLHAVIYTFGVQVKGSEEKVVATLSPGLLDTLRRNPDLVKYLIGWGETEPWD